MAFVINANFTFGFVVCDSVDEVSLYVLDIDLICSGKVQTSWESVPEVSFLGSPPHAIILIAVAIRVNV